MIRWPRPQDVGGSDGLAVVGFGIERDVVAGNLALHLLDAAHRDDDMALAGGAEIVEGVDIRDLLEQLRLGVGT
jgi:hypothetical protein